MALANAMSFGSRPKSNNYWSKIDYISDSFNDIKSVDVNSFTSSYSGYKDSKKLNKKLYNLKKSANDLDNFGSIFFAKSVVDSAINCVEKFNPEVSSHYLNSLQVKNQDLTDLINSRKYTLVPLCSDIPELISVITKKTELFREIKFKHFITLYGEVLNLPYKDSRFLVFSRGAENLYYKYKPNTDFVDIELDMYLNDEAQFPHAPIEIESNILQPRTHPIIYRHVFFKKNSVLKKHY